MPAKLLNPRCNIDLKKKKVLEHFKPMRIEDMVAVNYDDSSIRGNMKPTQFHPCVI